MLIHELRVCKPDVRRAERRTESDRRQQWRYRFRERRSAFDRRRRYLLLGAMRNDDRVLVAVLLGMNAMSLLDGLLTLAELGSGIALESNPVMAAVFALHPYAALVFKVCVVALASGMIWQWRRHQIVLAAAVIGLAVFTGVVAHHLDSLWRLGLI